MSDQITPQIDYTKINTDIVDYVITSGWMIVKTFPKLEREKALIEVEKHFKNLFLEKFGSDILYNSIICAYFKGNVDTITLDIEESRLKKLIGKNPPKS